MRTKSFRAFVWLIVFLAAAEVSLRSGGGATARGGGIAHDGPVVLLFGSSRTEFGLRPRTIEARLESLGIRRPWVADVTHRALTMIGMLRLWREKLLPVLRGTDVDGWIGVEVRGSGMNDSYRVFDEQDYLESLGWSEEEGRFLEERSPLHLLLSGRFDAGSRQLLRSLAIGRRREDLRRLVDPRRWFDEAASGDPDPRATGASPWERHLERLGVPWARGEKGWGIFQRRRREDLNAPVERRRFRRHHLKHFRLGGVQTACLRRILAEAREQGLQPFLYVMPITAVHRSFYEPGDYERFLALMRRLAEVEGVPFFDLDTGHGLPDSAFLDTGHLLPSAADPFSRRFAERVLLPLLRPKR